MDATKTTARLAELPEAVSGPLRAALAFSAAIEGKRQPSHYRREKELYAAALDAAGFTAASRKATRPIPRAAELAPQQRLVAEILAFVAGPPVTDYPLPGAAWLRRQWLGLDPPGALFRVEIAGAPAYFALRAADPERAAPALIAALPAADRVPVAVELYVAGNDHGIKVRELVRSVPADVSALHGAWAKGFADLLLELWLPGQSTGERGNLLGLPLELAHPTFLGLVRGGMAIEPRWDRLLPLGSRVPLADMLECIEAIPIARREKVVSGALGRAGLDHERIKTARMLLPHLPYACVARRALTKLDGDRASTDVIAQLRAVAAEHPAVAAVLAKHEAKLADLPRLKVAARGPVTLVSIDKIGRAQLEAANRSYSRQKRTAEQLFAGEETATAGIYPSSAERLRIAEDGEHVYDAWLYNGDSGTLFVAGTTRIVASMIQGGWECKARLRIALEDALAGAPRLASAPARKRPASGKPAARKPATRNAGRAKKKR